MYVVPMGGVNGNETLTQAVKREAQEEANIIIEDAHIQLKHVMHRLHHMPFECSFEQLDFFFVTHTYSGTIHNNEIHKYDELSFYPIANLPTNTVPFIRYAIEHIIANKYFSEFSWQQIP